MADTLERAESITRPLSILDLGLIPYEECWALQKHLATERAQGKIGDTLLLLELIGDRLGQNVQQQPLRFFLLDL